MENRWHHPGGKLREQGADALSDAELLAILISTIFVLIFTSK